MFLYDGNDNSLIGEFGDPAHSGGIYGLSFSPDGDRVLTASGDKTCKIFDVETRACVGSYSSGGDILDQQLGCLWSKNHLVSVSLSGNIHYLDPRLSSRTFDDIFPLLTNTTVDCDALYCGTSDYTSFVSELLGSSP